MIGKINIIFGSTASGKTAYGVKLAQAINGEVINADSMQIYQELPILTAQPTAHEMMDIPHHLYGFKCALDSYSVGEFVKDAAVKIKEVLALNKTPIFVGGTGMYIKSLIYGIPKLPKISIETKKKVLNQKLSTQQLYAQLQELDPQAALRLDVNDTQRILRALEVIIETNKSISEWQLEEKEVPFIRSQYHVIWLNPPREVIYKKINLRFINIIKNGAIWEVASLLEKAGGNSVLPKPHGLPEIERFLYGDISFREMIERSQQITRNYAKRQQTWARHQFDFDEVIY